METDLLDGVGVVGASERQVLEGSGEALELSQINNRRPGSGRDLGLRVHRHRDRLALHQPDAVQRPPKNGEEGRGPSW
jgi:hypothetical protein